MEKLTNNPLFKKIFNKFRWNSLVIIGLVGVILIAVSEIIPAKSEKSVGKNEVSAEDYQAQLETDLGEILSRVMGVGKVKIMVTL
ncbi:MAG: hypothetical protein RR253_01160, partial [Oscillospiraceae bacterium]